MEIDYSMNEYNFDIDGFLRECVNENISDIHFRINHVPLVRKDGIIIKKGHERLNNDDINHIVKTLTPGYILSQINKKHDLDFSLEIQNVARFRVNLFHENGNIGMVLRIIPNEIPNIEDLYLPPVLKNFTTFNNGLVLVTGPTGSGKSTTLASMLNHINNTSQKHIITLEDPVEFLYKSENSIFTQRQLDIDVDNFPNGVKYALRQDPDIILIGEMRDRETITSALKAAETGHLVLSTLHTTNAVKTITRIINAFEPHEREPVRYQIANILRATIAQKLVKKADNSGRVPALEILKVTPAIKDYIEKDKIESIQDLIKEGDFEGMTTMNNSLYKLVNAKLITREEALSTSDEANELEQMLKGAFQGYSLNFD